MENFPFSFSYFRRFDQKQLFQNFKSLTVRRRALFVFQYHGNYLGFDDPDDDDKTFAKADLTAWRRRS
jgi:hypothetical protein